MKKFVRILAIGALALGSLATGGAAQAVNTGPVPEEWRDPTWVVAQLSVVGRDFGHLPGRLGNQHVTQIDTFDEESVIAGHVTDWWCPSGVTAPDYYTETTACHLKNHYWVDFDYSQPTPLVENWSPTLRYLNFRIPIVLLDDGGVTVNRGKLSLHVKASGATSQIWSDGDYMDLLFRQGGHVTGGKFLGRPWLKMDSVDIADDEMWLLRYYE